MSQTYTVTAKTVDEAIDLASKLYGGRNKEISHEIISLPKKGFLGLGSKDAVIKVTVTDTEDDSFSAIVNEIKGFKPQPESGYDKPEEKAPQKSEEKKAEKKPEQKKPEAKKPEQKKAPQPEKKAQKEDAQPAPKAEKSESAPKAQKSEKNQKKQQPKKPAQTEKVEKAEIAKSAPSAEEVKLRQAVSEEEMRFAIGFINEMVANMKLSAEAYPSAAPDGEEFIKTETEFVYPAIVIDGDDTGILIGHHGETLDAIQYLVNLALYRRNKVEKGSRENIKITVDIENYREKREETLRALARRMAARAVKYKKNVFLEPMNPYERRIIHSELQTYPDVATHSVGSDINRKIIITYEGADKPVQSKKRSRHHHRGGRGKDNAAANAQQPEIPQGKPLPTLDDINE
ncbi:MAG: Jag N-terminal domain-containing protein [Clostridia bacterium]|nr:Jag N-terminal domain-containing protein [Clostridia bacterium]MBR5447585.1 Jag N-terminal domain-containing protein [Clostridia bacterium]